VICGPWGRLCTPLEGRRPFERSTPEAVYFAILTQPPSPARHAGPLMPLLNALMAKDPGQRPRLEAVAEQLAAIQHIAAPKIPIRAAAPPGGGPARIPRVSSPTPAVRRPTARRPIATLGTDNTMGSVAFRGPNRSCWSCDFRLGWSLVRSWEHISRGRGSCRMNCGR